MVCRAVVIDVLEMAGDFDGFEFQRLHGMGEALHDLLREKSGRNCRIYAPVGVHKDLLAYLVRRLLENGANSSFVHQLLNDSVPAEQLGWQSNARTGRVVQTGDQLNRVGHDAGGGQFRTEDVLGCL